MMGTELDLHVAKARLVMAEAEREGYVVTFDVPCLEFIVVGPTGDRLRISTEALVRLFDGHGPLRGWRELRSFSPRICPNTIQGAVDDIGFLLGRNMGTMTSDQIIKRTVEIRQKYGW